MTVIAGFAFFARLGKYGILPTNLPTSLWARCFGSVKNVGVDDTPRISESLPFLKNHGFFTCSYRSMGDTLDLPGIAGAILILAGIILPIL